jgi:hypothetical protein
MGPTTGKWSYSCLLATTENPQTCQYAYSVASISIFVGFVISLFQCLTLDCCGMGRLVESMFDLFACMWWVAGASTVTVSRGALGWLDGWLRKWTARWRGLTMAAAAADASAQTRCARWAPTHPANKQPRRPSPYRPDQVRAAEASMEGIPQEGWRQAVVALMWGAAAAFLALFITNIVLTSKIGKVRPCLLVVSVLFAERGAQ